MFSKFHLAFKVPCISEAKKFYCGVLGCDEGRSESGWADINFFGNELTLHEFPELKNSKLGFTKIVDMCDIPVPHFGVHLEQQTFDKLKERVEEKHVKVLLKPFIRFKGRPPEQETMFLCDPFDNIIELKTMRNPETLWDKKS